MSKKRRIRQHKRRVDKRSGRWLENNFRENRKLFWTEVNKVRKSKNSVTGFQVFEWSDVEERSRIEQ